MTECYKCGFWNSDYEGCTCPSYERWYACPIENKKPENVQTLKEIEDYNYPLCEDVIHGDFMGVMDKPKGGNLMESTQEFSLKVKIAFKEGTGVSLLCESYSIDTGKHELTLYDASGDIIGWFSEVAWVYSERQSEKGEGE